MWAFIVKLWRAFIGALKSPPAPGSTPDPSPGGGSPHPPPAPAEFTILPGVAREFPLVLPARVSFVLTPGPEQYWVDAYKAHFLVVIADRPGASFTGGRSGNPVEIGVRILSGSDGPLRGGKVKAMWQVGDREPRYGAPWQTGVPLPVVAVLTREGITLTVGAGTLPRINVPLPRKVRVIVGWPPASGGRPGPNGSRISGLEVL